MYILKGLFCTFEWLSERQVWTALLDHYYVRASCCASFLFCEGINQLILYKRASKEIWTILIQLRKVKPPRQSKMFFLSHSYFLHLREGFVSYLIFTNFIRCRFFSLCSEQGFFCLILLKSETRVFSSSLSEAARYADLHKCLRGISRAAADCAASVARWR